VPDASCKALPADNFKYWKTYKPQRNMETVFAIFQQDDTILNIVLGMWHCSKE
jgi:hypothetical protein